MSKKFVQLCEFLSGPDIAQERCILYDAVTKLDLGNSFIHLKIFKRSVI